MLSDDRLWYWNGQSWLKVEDSIQGRQALLESEVAEFVLQGYMVTARTDTQVQMLRPKKFSAFWAIAWFLVCGVGVLVYIFYYMGKRDDIVLLRRDE